MGLFDGVFAPNMGWLGSAMQQQDEQPQPQQPQDNSFGLSRFLNTLAPYLADAAPALRNMAPAMIPGVGPFIAGGNLGQSFVNASKAQAAQPSTNPADYAGLADAFGGSGPNGNMPPMGTPQNVGAAPGMNAPGAPMQGGPTLDQRAYGMSGPPGQMVPPSVIGGAPQMPQQASQAMAQAQPQPQQPQGPNFGQRMQAGFSNLESGGNPISALFNVAHGFATGQRTDAAGQPKLQKTGTDPMTGQDTFAWVNPQAQTMMPATMGQSGAPQGGPSLGAFSQAVQSGVTGDALYQHLPPQVANTVKSMIDGRAPVPAGAALRSPQGMALMNAANAIDPKFDQTQWAARNALRKNYEGGGKNYQELQAIGTVAGHLKDFAEAADKLDNTSFPLINQVVNAYRSGTGDARVDRFNTVKQAVSNELSKAYRGGNVTQGDVQEWQQNVNAAKSPEQLRGVIGKMNELLASKRQALEEGYRGVMGPNAPMPENFTATNDRTKKVFDDIAKWSNGERGGAATSGGLTAGTYNWTPQGVSR